MTAPPTSDNTSFMRRALRLAMNGRGGVEPNPMVGCVIVKNGRIIGEGYHQHFGGPHAELNALASSIESPEAATAYVTLEPCCHTNKKTPPCVPALVQAKLARVVIGCKDPNPSVAGRGIQQLKNVGIAVDVHVLEAQAKQLIAPFTVGVLHHRPYVTLKWAQSADGKIAGAGGKRVQITNATSNRVVHELRSRCDAIIVGSNTVLRDDPLLTARGVENPRPLLRCVFDRRLRIPINSRLVQSARQSPLIIFAGPRLPGSERNLKWDELERSGVELSALSTEFLQAPLLGLHDARGVTHCLVEPGPQLANAFFLQQAVDRLWVFHSPRKIDAPSAPSAAEIPSNFSKTAKLDLDGDQLVEYLNTKSDDFFAPVPSADLVLADEAHGAPLS